MVQVMGYNQRMLSRFKKKILGNEEPKADYVLVGLGNPKEKYEKTAHNAGFRVIEHLKKEAGLPSLLREKHLDCLVSKSSIEGRKVILALPLTFMNLSGGPTKRVVKHFAIPSERLVVVHDDIDLPVGTIRFSFSRSSGGHKGVQSIIKALGTKEFLRCRVGINTGNQGPAKKVVLKEVPQDMHDAEKRTAKELKKAISESNFEPRTIKTKENKDR